MSLTCMLRRALITIAGVAVLPTLVFAGEDSTLQILRQETAYEKAVRLGSQVEDDEFTPFVVRWPGQEASQVLTFEHDPGLAVDLYYPPGTDPDRLNPLPVMILPQGFQNGRSESYNIRRPRDQDFMIGLGMFFAVHGVVTVLYDADDLMDSFENVVDLLDRHAEELGLDMERLAIFGTSGHGHVADRATGSELVQDRLDAVVYLHGDQKGTQLRNASAAYMVVYTRDGSPWHQYGAAFARRVAMRRLELVEIEDAPHKNFFVDDESGRTQEIVDEIAEFVMAKLGSSPAY